MLKPFLIGTPLHFEGHVKVKIHTADGVDKLLDGGHRHCVIIIDRNAAEHPLRRFADLFEARAVRS